MAGGLRQLLVFVTAFSVLVVGATCTANGCLLPGFVVSGQQREMGCCEGHLKKDKPAEGKTPGSCPVCGDTLAAGPVVDKSVDHFSIKQSIVPSFAISLDLLLSPVCASPYVRGCIGDIPPPVNRPTLLSLFCALLT